MIRPNVTKLFSDSVADKFLQSELHQRYYFFSRDVWIKFKKSLFDSKWLERMLWNYFRIILPLLRFDQHLKQNDIMFGLRLWATKKCLSTYKYIFTLNWCWCLALTMKRKDALKIPKIGNFTIIYYTWKLKLYLFWSRYVLY